MWFWIPFTALCLLATLTCYWFIAERQRLLEEEIRQGEHHEEGDTGFWIIVVLLFIGSVFFALWGTVRIVKWMWYF